MYRVIISWPLVIFLSAAFVYAVGRNRFPPTKWFLFFLTIFSLAQISLFLNFETLDRLLIMDDHVRFYRISVDAKNMLLHYGSPFGFNHHFQGGIPALYWRGAFLELLPFSLIFGDLPGYQFMLIFFLSLIPLSLFLLTRELMRRDDIPRVIAFFSSFYIGMKGYIFNGMTPLVLSVPLVFLSLFFVLRYSRRKYGGLFAAVFCLGLLAYTHLGAFVLCAGAIAVMMTQQPAASKQRQHDIRRRVLLTGILTLVLAPLIQWLVLTGNGQTIEYDWTTTPVSIESARRALSALVDSIRHAHPLFLMIFFLYVVGRSAKQDDEKKIIKTLQLINIIFLLGRCLQEISLTGILAQRLEKFEPFVLTSSLACFFLTKAPTAIKWKVTLAAIIGLLVLTDQHSLMATEANEHALDPALPALVHAGDHILIENTAHLNAAKPSQPEVVGPPGNRHWIMALQKACGANFFAQIGEDPHAFNHFRDMYVTCGLFKGDPLDPAAPEGLITQLNEWGVNKACVWSDPAKHFFDQAPSFQWIGDSWHYRCYATQDFSPKVKGLMGATGIAMAEDPFSFTLQLENVTGPQTIIVNKNYFPMWSAHGTNGKKIPLNACGRKICFEADKNGEIIFTYPRYAALNLLAVLALAASAGIDIRRLKSGSRAQ